MFQAFFCFSCASTCFFRTAISLEIRLDDRSRSLLSLLLALLDAPLSGEALGDNRAGEALLGTDLPAGVLLGDSLLAGLLGDDLSLEVLLPAPLPGDLLTTLLVERDLLLDLLLSCS